MLTASGHNYRTLKNNFSASFYINHGGNEDTRRYHQATRHQFSSVLLLSEMRKYEQELTAQR